MSGNKITLKNTITISENTNIQINIGASAGILVPANGVNNGDIFAIKMISKEHLCSMNYKLILFKKFVIRSNYAFASYFPILPKSGENILFYFQFKLPVQLEKGDLIFISFLSFQYNSSDYINLENSVKSNINISSFYNRVEKRLQLTLRNNFSAFSPISVNLTQNSGITIISSIPSNAFQLQINSKNGEIANQIMGTKCLGFCSTNVTYSTIFAEKLMTGNFTFSFSSSLPQNTTVNFELNYFLIRNKTAKKFFIEVENEKIISKIEFNSIHFPIDNSSLFSGKSGPSSRRIFLSIKIPFEIKTLSLISIKIFGLEFEKNNTEIESPFVECNIVTTALGLRSVIFPTPSSIQPAIIFPISNVLFSPLFAGKISVLNFTFQNNLIISTGSILCIKLPYFKFNNNKNDSNNNNKSSLLISSIYFGENYYWNDTSSQINLFVKNEIQN